MISFIGRLVSSGIQLRSVSTCWNVDELMLPYIPPREILINNNREEEACVASGCCVPPPLHLLDDDNLSAEKYLNINKKKN